MSDFVKGQPDAGAFFSDHYLAWYFDVSREQVQRRCFQQQWPCIRIGKKYRFKTEHITAIEALSESKPKVQTADETWGRKRRTAS